MSHPSCSYVFAHTAPSSYNSSSQSLHIQTLILQGLIHRPPPPESLPIFTSGADISFFSTSRPFYLHITQGSDHYLAKTVSTCLPDAVICARHSTLKLQKWVPASNSKLGVSGVMILPRKTLLSLLPTPSLPPVAP